MIVLRDHQQLTQVAQPEIKDFLRQRFHDICDPEPYDPDEHGFFILIEPGDTSEQIESDTGYSLLKSLFNGSEYGDPDFTRTSNTWKIMVAFMKQYTSSPIAALPW